MVSMDYFRRPVLAGHTLTRQTYGTVRGDIRRTDVDGSSTVPYFPGVSLTQTLLISIDGAGAVTATISGTPPGGLNNVLADINTALGITGTAFDADGTIAIKTATAGSAGSVEVTGGTAAAALGFDLKKNKYKSYGGEIQSSPEARRGNAFGAGFLSRGENFNSESVQRGLARISANADVLYSEAARNDAVVRLVPFTNVDGTRLQITTATDKLFTGLGLLTNGSTKEDLAPYFYLVDTVTKQPAKSRVVAVVRGAPGGGTPFANATTWSGGGSAGNILGVSLDKVSAASITTITGGRVIECAAANFADVQSGDFASIAGATNLTPFSNNGQRWVVEEVLSTTTVVLRPMSRSELAQAGFTPTDVQPIIELNDNLQTLESFGTLTIKTGTYCSGVGVGLSVVVSPSIPTGATYQLFAAQPISNREKTVYDDQRSSGAPFREFVSDLDPVANWTLTGAVATLGGGNCNITAATIVWHGRVYNLPAQTFLPADFANGSNYVYWDEATGNYAIAATTAGFYQVLDPASGTKGHAIAFVSKGGGVLTSVSPMTRLRGEKAISVTVGTGGQFPDLIQATLWARALDTTYAEGSTSTGTYPHFEFILLNDTTTSNLNPVLPNPGCIVRGINPNVQLNLGTGFFNVLGKVAEFRDFKLVATGAKAIGIGAAVDRISINNVQHVASDGSSLTEIVGTSGNSMKDFWMRDSSFRIKQGISSAFTATLGVANALVKNCKLTYDPTGAVVPHIFQKNDATPDWDGNFLVVEDTEFLNSFGATTGDLAAILVANNVATSTMFFRNVKFSLGAFSSANANVFIKTANNATVVMDNFEMTSGSIQKIITGASANAKFYNSIFRCCPATGIAAFSGHTISNCYFYHTDTAAGGSGFGADVVASGLISECTFNGPFNTCVRVTAADVRVLFNRIDHFKTANGIPSVSIDVQSGGVGALVQGNIVVWATSASTLSGLACITASPNNVSILGNKCYFPSPTVSNVSVTGISNGGSGGITSGNLVAMTTTGTAAGSQSLTGLSISGTEQTCTGNVLNLTGSTTQDWRGVQWVPSLGILSGNYIKSYGRTITTSSATDDSIISNNEFVSTTANAITNGHVQWLGGSVTGNRFKAGNAANGVMCGYGNFANNFFYTKVVLDNGLGGFGLTHFSFTGNYVSGNFDASTNSPNWIKLDVTGNTIEGNAVIDFSFVVGSPPHVDFSSNQVTGTTSITSTVVISTVVVGNELGGFVSISLQGPASTIVFSSNRTDDAVTLSAGIVECTSNRISSDLTTSHGNAPGSSSQTHIVSNRISGNLSASSQFLVISSNHINTSCICTRPTALGASPGTCVISENHINGDLQADTIDAGVYLFGEVVVRGNHFEATTISTWSVKGETVYVCENKITPTNGVAPIIGGSQITFDNNYIFATAGSTGANQNTIITLTHISALGTVWMTGNRIFGRVVQDAGLKDGWFDRNYIFHYNNVTANLAIGACSESCHVINNNFISDNSGVGGTNFSAFNVRIDGTSNNIFIIGNKMKIPALSASYSVSLFCINILLGTGPFDRVLIENNILEKPDTATVTGNLQVTFNVKADSTSNMFLVGNLMFRSAGVLGATYGRGDPSLFLGPANFTLSA